MRFIRPALFVAMVAGLSACGDFPQLQDPDEGIAGAPRTPELVPIEDIYAALPPSRITDETSQGVEARAARLKARASRLRRGVIDDETRARFEGGVS